MSVQKVKEAVKSVNQKEKQFKLTPEMVDEIRTALKEVEDGKIIPNDKFRERFINR